MKEIILSDSSLEVLLKHIERFEALPSSKRYFQEIFGMGQSILEYYGQKNGSLFLKRKNLIILHLEHDYCFGLEYVKPRFKNEEIMFMNYIDNNEEKQLSLERIKINGEFEAKKATITNLRTEKEFQNTYD
jgi:hypothetical protein